MKVTKRVDVACCPLCGEPNECVVAGTGKEWSEPCWCRKASFPQSLLDQVPQALRHKACICARCVETAGTS